MRIQSWGIAQPGEAYLWDYEDGPLPGGHIRLQTMYTGISAGTELTFYKGTNPYLHTHWNARTGCFQDGPPTQAFPVPFLGYMEVGRVIESRDPSIPVGQVMAMAYGHKTGHTADPATEFMIPLPTELPPVLGIYAAQMGPICANALLHAAADITHGADVQLDTGVRGKTVLVMGAGVIGLLLGLWAQRLGAHAVAVVDSTSARLKAAAACGLIPLHTTQDDPARWCADHWWSAEGDRGADLVFQCRGQTSALHLALQCLRPQATLIDLAFYQGGMADLRLGEEFHHNGLRMQCAQIGRVPRGLGPFWNRRRLAQETLTFLASDGHTISDQIITDMVPFAEAGTLMAAMAQRQRHVVQAVLTVGP